MTSARINQYVSRLQKLFAAFEPDKKFIENLRGRGYRFVQEVVIPESSHLKNDLDEPYPAELFEKPEPLVGQTRKRSAISRIVLVAVFASLLLSSCIYFWKTSSSVDEEQIRQVIRESQNFESLVLYRKPNEFNETDLDRYWVPDGDARLNHDRGRIRDSVKKLAAEGQRYGDETRHEQFEFQSVEIDTDRSSAIVKTLEKWFIAVYLSDGSLQKNKTVGPYFVSYILKKIDGRWLVEKSSTARVNRPTPRLSDINNLDEPKPGQEFLVTITGQDFEPEMIYVEVIGPGCPESKPCKVPNSGLREKSNLTETILDAVPLTLSSGDFKIAARNGESPASNPLYLRVP